MRLDQVAPTLAEAALLGVTGLDGLSTFGRQPGRGRRPRHGSLDALLPAPVDHVLLQADLTAIAPGPLEHELAQQLALVADVESRGGATVYRFAATSVRRAFDAGWSAAEVHEFVARHVAHAGAAVARPTWSTTSPAGSARCAPGTPSRSCAATTRPR